ncbi:unnamed protein product, partial [Iphiclides podalirius]
MTLRRCDSLPARLREYHTKPDVELGQPIQLPDSNTVPNFTDPSKLDEVIATWKSLQTDVIKLSNGNPSKNERTDQKINETETITHSFISDFKCTKSDKRKKLVFSNASTTARKKDDNPTSSLPAEVAQANSIECGASKARRRTLLERLLSWRTPECNCREKFTPKLRPTPVPRPEDLLCTCGVSRTNFADKRNRYTERGRSKSVGYEAAREVTQFRRCASAGATVGAETPAALRARAALTLARRYYPEGGWGWTITVVGTLVQIITHGLQLGGGTGAVACTAAVKYRVPPLYTYGE